MVANNAKVQLEEKERENREKEERRREEEEIAETIRTQLTHAQKNEIFEFCTENPKVSLEDSAILFSAKFSKNLPKKIIAAIRTPGINLM